MVPSPRTRLRRRSTSSTPRRAQQNEQSDVRSCARGQRRAGAASCRSIRCARRTDTCADAPMSLRSPGNPDTRRSRPAGSSARWRLCASSLRSSELHSCACEVVEAADGRAGVLLLVVEMFQEVDVEVLEPSTASRRSRSSGQRFKQGGRAIVAAIHDSVDEQGRRAHYLSRGNAALHVSTDARAYPIAGAVRVEAGGIQIESGGIQAQVVVLERGLAMEEHRAHLPEPALERCGFCCFCGSCCMRVDPRQWKVTEREADTIAQPPFDAFDLAERPARVRALVVAVLDDEAPERP